MSYSVKLAESEDIDKLIQLRLDFSDANNGPHPETYELRKANLKSYFERHLNRDCYAAIVEQAEEQRRDQSAEGVVAADDWAFTKTRPALPAQTGALQA